MTEQREQKQYLIVIFIVILVFFFNMSRRSGYYDKWVVFSYAGLVPFSTITHSGETVAEVIRQLKNLESARRGLVQPYLEPFSALCNFWLQSDKGKDKDMFSNITELYPEGSLQPAWVALFKEGHYQLFYNTETITVFLKGENPTESFQRSLPVIRHPIQDIINCNSLPVNEIEVYLFKNDHIRTEVHLFLRPIRLSVTDLNLKELSMVYVL